MVAIIYVDGRRIDCRSVDVDTLIVSKMQFVEGNIMYDGLLKFAALVSSSHFCRYQAARLIVQRTTDRDEEVTLSGARLQSLGKIRVNFVRATMGGISNIAANCVVEPDVGVAAEKAKKQVVFRLQMWMI